MNSSGSYFFSAFLLEVSDLDFSPALEDFSSFLDADSCFALESPVGGRMTEESATVEVTRQP